MVVLTDRLFKAAKVDRAAVSKALNKNKHCDTLMKALNLKLSLEEKRLSSGLFDVVSRVSSERAQGYGFAPFPQHELEHNLQLTAPRKVTSYQLSRQTAAIMAAEARGEVPGAADGKDGKAKGIGKGGFKRGSGNKAFKVGGNAKAIRAHHAEEQGHFVDEEDDYGYGYGGGVGAGGMGVGGTTEDGTDLADLGAPEQLLSSAEVVLPSNFLAVIQGVFQLFWDLDMGGNPQVSQAFFANIDSANCGDYGLAVFADSAMSLSIIRDRMEATAATMGAGQGGGYSRAYRSPEDFYSDFRQVCVWLCLPLRPLLLPSLFSRSGTGARNCPLCPPPLTLTHYPSSSPSPLQRRPCSPPRFGPLHCAILCPHTVLYSCTMLLLQMFENIFAFFPPQSPAQLKAAGLNTLFHEKWEGAKASFKYKNL